VAWIVALGVLALVLIWLRQFEVLAVAALAVAVFMDWYHLVPLPFYFPFLATVLALALIVVVFVAQLPDAPWSPLTLLPLWILLLALTALQIIPAADRIDATAYYINVFVISFLMYILGRLIVPSAQRLRNLVSWLSHLGALIGLHTMIFGLTGIFLFSTLRSDEYLASHNGFQFPGLTISRAGSFLGNPDWDGIFLATMAFLPIGLAFAERRMWARVAYLAEALVILGGLLFTFTTGSFLALGAGIVVFLALLGSRRLRIVGVTVGLAASAALALVFRTQVTVLVEHTFNPTGLPLRLGAWVTALKTIAAYPLTGVGLGYSAYVQGTEPFRDPKLQSRPLVQPHNTYLELAVMVGLPILILFLAILASQVRPLLATYRAASPSDKSVVAGAIAATVVLAANSLSIPGWTAEPLAALGWLLLGALSSPLLAAAGAPARSGVWQRLRAQSAWNIDALLSQVRNSAGKTPAGVSYPRRADRLAREQTWTVEEQAERRSLPPQAP
jgi:O-antigen ligase